MTVILNPAHDAVPSDDAVLHIIQVPLLFPDLPPDAGLHAVQVLLTEEVQTAPGEVLPPPGGGGGVGEVPGVLPAARAEDQTQSRARLPNLPEARQVFPVPLRILQDQGAALRVNGGEGIVNLVMLTFNPTRVLKAQLPADGIILEGHGS